MAKHTEHSILGVIENMSYFESKETGNKEYVFGKGGGRKLADELNTQLLGELPLEQPTWNPKDFSPSIYQADDRLGEIYTSIAQKVIASTIKNKDRFSVKLTHGILNFMRFFLLQNILNLIECFLVSNSSI